ncbi:MAG: hypothetical protein D6705_02575 [Deltaproteobacteria bacterium]|nr:MAG: hypothetical protein D6705_02575 [Deltaproteobacteria bacterium]
MMARSLPAALLPAVFAALAASTAVAAQPAPGSELRDLHASRPASASDCPPCPCATPLRGEPGPPAAPDLKDLPEPRRGAGAARPAPPTDLLPLERDLPRASGPRAVELSDPFVSSRARMRKTTVAPAPMPGDLKPLGR